MAKTIPVIANFGRLIYIVVTIFLPKFQFSTKISEKIVCPIDNKYFDIKLFWAPFPPTIMITMMRMDKRQFPQHVVQSLQQCLLPWTTKNWGTGDGDGVPYSRVRKYLKYFISHMSLMA